MDIGAPGWVIVDFNGRSYLVAGTSASTALASGAAAGFAEKNRLPVAQVEDPIRQGLAVK